MELQIWILYRSWEDGNATSLFSSAEAARSAVQTYVHDQWNNGHMDDEEYPGDSPKAVEAYFQYYEDTEYYNIYGQSVDFPDGLVDPKLAGDEVILNEEECNLIVTILGDATYLKIGLLLEMSKDRVSILIHKVIQKLQM